jgi:hypothetical protein
MVPQKCGGPTTKQANTVAAHLSSTYIHTSRSDIHTFTNLLVLVSQILWPHNPKNNCPFPNSTL